jgi:uncharacterized protein (TIGR00255 family)
VLISMTGYGEAHAQTDEVAVVVEVRTTNSRHLKVSFRSTEGYGSLEPDVEAVVRQTIRRGTVQLNLRIDRQASSEDFRINPTVLEGYRSQIESLIKRTGWSDTVALDSLLLLPGVVNEKHRADFDPREVWPVIEPAIKEALAAVARMRIEEGKALTDDLAANGAAVEKSLDEIAKRAPDVVQSYQARLVQRVNQSLSKLNVSVEPSDLLREVSLFVDRSDISEEIVRLRSHLQQYADALQLDESSGRKLEFIVQEMGREINTIGSKANDAEISQYVVEIKSALERIREQIQNVE